MLSEILIIVIRGMAIGSIFATIAMSFNIVHGATNIFNFAQGNGKTLIETIMPSEAPPLVAITYKGRTYGPLIIENINIPLGSPIDVNGNFTSLVIPVTFSTLTAIDGNDWMKYSTTGF